MQTPTNQNEISLNKLAQFESFIDGYYYNQTELRNQIKRNINSIRQIIIKYLDTNGQQE
uniref:Uncharacterized protein n=1 Tax=viral metagenome TaxID=1070528 RepID=A0A6H2A5K2_9ZZZZ